MRQISVQRRSSLSPFYYLLKIGNVFATFQDGNLSNLSNKCIITMHFSLPRVRWFNGCEWSKVVTVVAVDGVTRFHPWEGAIAHHLHKETRKLLPLYLIGKLPLFVCLRIHPHSKAWVIFHSSVFTTWKGFEDTIEVRFGWNAFRNKWNLIMQEN